MSTSSSANQYYGAVADFDTHYKLLDAVRAVREMGYRKLDAYTPFPIHGIDEAMGERRSILGRIVFAAGITGCLSGFLLQWYTGAVDYPLVIGGKPYFAIEFAVPPAFELTVLFSAFAAVFGMLVLNGLPRLYHPIFNYSNYRGATDDRFLLVIEREDPSFDPERTPDLLKRLGAGRVELVEE
jgi:hypothetical protein